MLKSKCDEEAMMWQEDAEQPESEDYEISKYEFDKISKNKGEEMSCLMKQKIFYQENNFNHNAR